MDVQEKEQILNLSPEDKKRYVNKIRISHPEFVRVVNEIEDYMQLAKLEENPSSLLVIGDSGLGKSTIFEYIVNKHKKVTYTEGGTNINIVSSTIPKPVTITHVTEKLLKALGDLRFDKGTRPNKLDRLEGYIKDCEVEFIILDEFQHFLKPGNTRVNHDVADWFKSLMNATSSSFILFGTQDAGLVLEDNNQLDRRFLNFIQIRPYGFKTSEEKKIFKELLHQFDIRLPFEQPSKLNTNEMSKRFYKASEGKIYVLHQVLSDATYYASKENAKNVALKHLARAFNRTSASRKIVSNPFLE